MSTELEEKATAVTVVEQSSPLITIEPAKYVALVFEPFAKRLAAAKETAKTITFDIATTSGMRAAVEQRAVFRDIRVGSEKVRKERKAPILEIGKLLDGRQKEMEAEIEPYESRFDEAIKAEEKRKDDEKIAKALVESQRITAIRQKIDEIKDCVVVAMGRSSDEIESAIGDLESTQITTEDWAEYTGEAQATQMATVEKLKVMLDAQILIEIEQQRMQQEREQLVRDRAAAEERERAAAEERAAQEKKDRAARLEQERRDREVREQAEADQREAARRAQEAMDAEREAHEARMAAQQAEIDAKQAVIDAAIAEQERIAREAREAQEAVDRRKQEAADMTARLIDERIQAEKDAAEAERVRQVEAAAEEERQARAAREAADTAMRNAASALYAALISQVSWAGEVSDEFLDGEPGLRDRFVADRKAAADALKLARGEA